MAADLPERIEITEVGPRDGLQMEAVVLSTRDKLTLIDLLVDAGLREIEVTSFVNPRAVPQMADADDVVRGLPDRPDVRFKALFLNPKGLQRALAHDNLRVEGDLFAAASDVFSRRNMNRSTDLVVEEVGVWDDLYRGHHITTDTLSVMTAFGCNYEGDVPAAKVIDTIARIDGALGERGGRLRQVMLADTMGWATPRQVRAVVEAIRDRWPALTIKLHFHDTRGLALLNATAGLEMGVTRFESSIGGMGGCPFAGSKGATGNMCTEDFAFLCDELGITTGLDVDRLIVAATAAERMVGHELPGKVMKAGGLAGRRRAAWAGLPDAN